MSLGFRFAIVSDLHIALPQTIWDNSSRFHLVEVSIAALESVLTQLEPLDLDFLLLPGDLTQHGEPQNHAWLIERLSRLPYPVCVVPGNHDAPTLAASDRAIGIGDFPHYYQKFGYGDSNQLYYVREVLPGVQVIGLNSNQYEADGSQFGMGRIDPEQLTWLQATLAASNPEDLILVMVHHNVIEHLPGQLHNPLGRRYMLENAPDLLHILRSAGVQLIFTGHLHVQDIAVQNGIYDITTGSLVSYPHPYRILNFSQTEQGRWLQIESGRVEAVPNWPNLQHTSREWMGDRSFPFMLKLLTQPPLSLPPAEAEQLAPILRHFWADIANGDAAFDFPQLPPRVRCHFEQFSAQDEHGNRQCIDNAATLQLDNLDDA